MTPANTFIVDTNVILVANGRHDDVSPECVSSCASRLRTIVDEGRITLDDAFRILREYMNKTQPNRGRGPGDAFVKWALRVNRNTARCDRVPIHEHPARGFEEFPDDPRLADFDPADRKFVAVARTHVQKPPVLQAVDSKWLDWRTPLMDNGVDVEFVCPKDIRRFQAKKAGQ